MLNCESILWTLTVWNCTLNLTSSTSDLVPVSQTIFFEPLTFWSSWSRRYLPLNVFTCIAAWWQLFLHFESRLQGPQASTRNLAQYILHTGSCDSAHWRFQLAGLTIMIVIWPICCYYTLTSNQLQTWQHLLLCSPYTTNLNSKNSRWSR